MSDRPGVKWGISLPQHFPEGPVDLSLIRDFARRAEALGYHSLWVQEGVVSHFPVLEPLSLLAYCSALTERVKLGSSVILLPLRSAAQMAAAVASMDQLSQGRLILGVGLGNPKYYPAYGISAGRRGKRLMEYVRLMKVLWTESSVSFQGEFCRVEGLTLEPKPVQRPHPPLWFGASHPSALRRAARWADGWMGAGSSSTGEFEERVSLLRRFLKEEGRDPVEFTISKRVYLAVDDRPARAEEQLRRFFAAVYGNAEKGPRVSVYGPPRACAEGLRRVLSQEPDLVLVTLVHDHIRQMERLSAEVLPRLQPSAP